MKLLIIDGNSVINRAYFGIQPMNAPDGTPTNAVYGFLNIYRRVMSASGPDAVAVTFDLPEPTFRHEEYSGYKANRKGMPDDLAVQMPVMKQVLDAMNVRYYELAGWEADDLIGSIAGICGREGWQCEAVTGDRDSFQLIDDHTVIRYLSSRANREDRVYDEKAFREEYGFDPVHMIDFKALMGDASDNIPGVKGIGDKTARDLVQRFGSVDYIYANLDSLDITKSVRAKLEAGREDAAESYDLATIRKNAPVEFVPGENMVCPVNNDELWKIFDRLDFRRMTAVFSLTRPEGMNPEENTGKDIVFPEKTVSIETVEDLEDFRREAENSVISVRLGDSLSAVVMIPGDGKTAYAAGPDSPVFVALLDVLFSGEIRKAGHNVKDTMRFLLENGYGTDGWEFDTAIAAWLINSTEGDGYDLYKIAGHYFGENVEDSDTGGQVTMTREGPGRDPLVTEAAMILALREKFIPMLNDMDLMKVFSEIEMPLCHVLAEMEQRGFRADRKALEDYGKLLSQQIDMITEEIYSLAGCEFNINSPRQLGEVLFEKLNLPAPKKTSRGYPTNADVLEKLKPDHPVVGLVLEYRELAKLKSTYADGLLKVIGPDGRIHTSFQMTATATGRLSSTEPNLQNIPVRREIGSELRKMFAAEDGNVLVDADYSQVELRILAHISGDRTARETFRSGEDIHRMTAAHIMGIPPEEVTPLQRSRAKAVNFGIIYGISAFSLSEDIGTTVSEAREYINSYMERYSGIKDYMERAVSSAKNRGYTSTIYGRRRPLPELSSKNYNERSFGERVARNMPIQGTAADIIKIAMINADRALKEAGLSARLILQVHDELIVECPEEEKEQAAGILRREMEGAASLSVPLTAEVRWGKTWYEAK